MSVCQCTESTCHSLSHTYTQPSLNIILHHKVVLQHQSMTSPVIQCVTLSPKCVTLSLTVSPHHSPGGPQSPSASEGAWSSPQGRHCSSGSGRGPQPPADLDGTERQGHTGTGDELHTDTLKHTPHVHMHGTRVYVMCTYIHTHSHTHCTYVHAYTHTHTHCTYCTHNIQPHIHAYLPPMVMDPTASRRPHCL